MISTDNLRQSSECDDEKQIESSKGEPFVDKDAIAAEVGYRLGVLSYEAEMSRYDSLISTASHLMTYVSIESVALLTLLPTLLNYSWLPIPHIIGCYLLVFGLLFATLAAALVARFRFTYVAPANPKVYGDLVKQSYSQFESKVDGASWFCECVEKSYGPIRDRNDKISKWVGAANALAFSNLIVVVISIISIVSTLPYLI